MYECKHECGIGWIYNLQLSDRARATCPSGHLHLLLTQAST